MKRSELKRTTPLKSRKPLERRVPLKAVSGDRTGKTRRSTLRHGGFTPASSEQRAKVKEQGCRVTAEHGPHVHPAHVTDRALGGCDSALCVVGLRADYHRLYDMGAFDVLPYLTKEEQAHAVEHSGLLGALKQLTGVDWAPTESRTEMARIAREYPDGDAA